MKWLWELLASFMPVADWRSTLKAILKQGAWATVAAFLLWYGTTHFVTPMIEELRLDRAEFKNALIKTNDDLLETTRANTAYLQRQTAVLERIEVKLQ